MLGGSCHLVDYNPGFKWDKQAQSTKKTSYNWGYNPLTSSGMNWIYLWTWVVHVIMTRNNDGTGMMRFLEIFSPAMGASFG